MVKIIGLAGGLLAGIPAWHLIEPETVPGRILFLATWLVMGYFVRKGIIAIAQNTIDKVNP